MAYHSSTKAEKQQTICQKLILLTLKEIIKILLRKNSRDTIILKNLKAVTYAVLAMRKHHKSFIQSIAIIWLQKI